MNYRSRTKEELINELEALNRRLTEAQSDFKIKTEYENLTNVLESMSDAFVSLDKNWCYTYMNKKAGEIFARDPVDMIGKNIWTEFPEGVGQPFHLNYEKAMREGVFIRMEEYYPPYNKWFENRINPTQDGIAIFFTDITEKKQYEKELVSAKENAIGSEAKIKNIFDTLQDAFFQVDINGRFTFANSNALKMYGYGTEEELIGKPAKDLYAREEDRNRMIEDLRKTGKLADWVGLGRKKDGTNFWISMNVQFLKDEEDAIIGTLGMVHDIDSRKKTEEALQESQLRFKTAFMTSLDGFYISTFEEGVFVEGNNVFFEMFGYTKDEIIGKTALQLNIFSDPQDRTNMINQLKEIGQVRNMELRGGKKNGEIIICSISTSITQLNGHPHIIGLIRDITEQKNAELELIKAKEKAEENDRLKSAFLANMSHEIRTPMNGILGFSELLKEPKLTGEEQHEYITIIEKSGLRMLNIINDIIDISKIESGQMKVDIKESNINGLLEYISIFFNPDIESKGMKLLIECGLPSEESLIKTDNEKVIAIFTNLVKNAIKYSDLGTIKIGYVRKNQNLEFYITDQGIGIPLDRQEAIFERFIQADIGDQRAYQGAGLGLTITKSYVEMLGGQIWLQSIEGEGTTFYFTLPYIDEPVEKISKDKLIHPGKVENHIKPLRILIAEDNFYAAKLLEIIVKKLSEEIVIVETGREAIEACRNNPDIDLILMDIKLPEINGYEATRQIREFNTKVVIIAQTAFALVGDREQALAAGCNDYISKPVNAAVLKDLIQKYFNH